MDRLRRLDWNHLRAFLATAEQGSLSAAAKHLGLTQPTLSRQVSALEDELSLLLFERVGRGLSLTSAGHDLLAHARAMGAAAERLTFSAIGQQSEISGRVSISASDILSHNILPDVVADLRRLAPQLRPRGLSGVEKCRQRMAVIMLPWVEQRDTGEASAVTIRDLHAKLRGR